MGSGVSHFMFSKQRDGGWGMEGGSGVGRGVTLFAKDLDILN